MLTADEAYKLSVEKLEDQQTIDELLELESKIKDATIKGYFACVSKPLPITISEKLAIELEEFGYNASVQSSGVVAQNGESLPFVMVNWRYKPSAQSRVDQPISCN